VIIQGVQEPAQDIKGKKDTLSNPDVVKRDANRYKGAEWDDE
jgi:hypothetical protein